MSMRKIPEKDLKAFAEIIFNAYPGFGAPDPDKVLEFLKPLLGEDRNTTLIGSYDGDVLTGCMVIYDYDMNFRGRMVKAKGVGMVAVDLVRKKEKICRDMIRFFISECEDNGCAFALLYPFRPDFYKKMGFGYSSSLRKYRLATGAFPDSGDKTKVRIASESDIAGLLKFYNTEAGKRHGMILKREYDIKRLLQGKMRTVLYEEEGVIKGYMSFNFKKGNPENFTSNDMVVREMLCDRTTPGAAGGLYAFVNSQKDQCLRTEITTFDEDMYHLFTDPRDSSGDLMWGVNHLSYTGGVGLMCRVTCPEMGELLSVCREGELNVLFRVSDSFLERGEAEYGVSFAKSGTGKLDGKPDLTIEADVDIFSSLLIGSLSSVTAWRMGLIKTDDPSLLKTLDLILSSHGRPRCLAEF